MLEECKASVRAQTLPAVEHLIEVDEKRTEKCGPQLNRMAASSDCEWLATLADDDLMLPHHLETLAAHVDEADVIYSYCDVIGRGSWSPNHEFDPKSFHFPATALIRRALWEKTTGWGKENRAEDNAFWQRCKTKEARLLCVPEITWVYRFHGRNKSLFASHDNFWEGVP